MTIFKKHSHLISFYTSMVVILTFAFTVSGKDVQAYFSVAEASFYSGHKTPSVEVTTIETIKESSAKEIETITREILPAFSNIQEEEIENSSIMQAFLPIGLPIEGIVTSEFGYRIDPTSGNGHNHNGTDISLKIGTPVPATANGIVTVSKYSNSYGYMVEVEHLNGYSTVYAHNSELAVNVGDYVFKGDIVALSGNTGYSTGPHLHYEVRLNGKAMAPIM